MKYRIWIFQERGPSEDLVIKEDAPRSDDPIPFSLRYPGLVVDGLNSIVEQVASVFEYHGVNDEAELAEICGKVTEKLSRSASASYKSELPTPNRWVLIDPVRSRSCACAPMERPWT